MLKTLISLILIIAFFQIANAQIPNDNCSGATSIFIGESGQSGLITTDLEFAHPSYQGSNECIALGQPVQSNADRWYSFVANGTISRLVIDDLLWTSISVFDGLCGTTNHLACNSEPFETVIGESYLVRVMHNGVQELSDASASFTINSIDNDTNLDCNSALNISAGELINFAGNYSDSGYTSTCNNSTEDLWFSFIAPPNGSIETSAAYGEILEGTCGNLTSLFCLSGGERIIHGFIPGDQYFIRIVNNDLITGFQFDQSSVVVATNSECNTRLPLIPDGPTVSIQRDQSNTGNFWYSFVAPASGSVRYSGSSSNFIWDTYTSDCANLLQVGVNERSVYGLIPGNTYLVKLDVITSQLTTFGIEISSFSGAQNNLCESPTALTVAAMCDGSNATSGTFSITNRSLPACSFGDNVYYSFNAPVSGAVDITLDNTFHSYKILEGGCIDYQAVHPLSLNPGTEYLIEVNKKSSSLQNFTICVAEKISNEPNEVCTDAIEVFYDIDFMYNGETARTEEIGSSECTFNIPDLWYKFIATSPACAFTGSSYNDIEVYSNTCGDLEELYLSSAVTQSGIEVFAGGLTIGETYYLRVFGSNNTTRTISASPLADNDECSGATIIFDGSYSFTTDNTDPVSLSSVALPSCVDPAEQQVDIWYKYTATSNAINFNTLTGSVVALYENGCGSLTEVDCDANNIGQFENLNVGSEYIIRVIKYPGAFSYNLTDLALPANANCEGSIFIPVWEETYQGATQVSFEFGGVGGAAENCGETYGRWYDFVSPTSGAIRMISQSNGISSSGYSIEVYDACNGTLVHCQTLSNNQETETVELVPNQNYKVRFASNNNSTVVSLLNIRSVPLVPAESSCAEAISISVSADDTCGQSVSGSSNNAALSPGSFCGDLSAQAIFYSITADEDANHRIEISNAAAQHRVSVFTDCILTNPIACGLGSLDVMLVNGTSYIIAVYPETKDVQSTFDLCIYKPTIINTGSVGINTNNPQARLDVNGGIRPGFTSNPLPGVIRWNSDLEVFDGSEWKSAIDWDHTAIEDIDMTGFRISNLAEPVLPTDAVTKLYVDGITDQDNSPSNEIQILSTTGNQVSLSQGGGSITINVDDADADPNNEIQTLFQNSNIVGLTGNGGSVDINDADADPNNELQTLTQNGNSVSLSSGGGTITVDDGDADDENELQDLSLSGTMLSLSGSTETISINDGDADDQNELQTILKSGIIVTLSDGGGSVNVADNDNDETNEIQTLSRNGNQILLTDGGAVSLVDDDGSNTNELQTLTQNGNSVSLSSGGGTITVNDGDADDQNELQTLSRNGNQILLTDGGAVSLVDDDGSNTNELQTLTQNGNSVSLSSGGGTITVNDGDADDQNELQTISKSGIIVTLSDGGGSVNVADNDNDETNEIQTLSRNGNQILLTDGGAVSLVDDDGSNTNELQTLSQNGNSVSLSNGGGSITVDDGDSDDENELVTSLALSGTILQVNQAGGAESLNLSSIATKWDNNGSEIYYNNANVGIGIDNPTEKLDVRGTTQVRMNSSGISPQLQLVELSNTDGARINFESSIETNNKWTLFGRPDNTLTDNSFNLFHTVGGNILQVKGNGDIGLNGAPDTDLHVYHGNNGAGDGLKLENSAVSASPWWRIYVSSGSSDLRLFSKSQGSTIIGVFNDVTGAYTTPSDRRLKESIQDLHFDWDGFLGLDLYSYKYKGGSKQSRSIGIMAQDLIQVYPELVSYEEDADQYLVNYSGLGVVAIKAVQEQQKEIEKLKKENENMKTELTEIKAMLKKLTDD